MWHLEIVCKYTDAPKCIYYLPRDKLWVQKTLVGFILSGKIARIKFRSLKELEGFQPPPVCVPKKSAGICIKGILHISTHLHFGSVKDMICIKEVPLVILILFTALFCLF